MEGHDDKWMMDARTDRWRKKTAEGTTLRLNCFRDLWPINWRTELGFKEIRKTVLKVKKKINGWMDRWMGIWLE